MQARRAVCGPTVKACLAHSGEGHLQRDRQLKQKDKGVPVEAALLAHTTIGLRVDQRTTILSKEDFTCVSGSGRPDTECLTSTTKASPLGRDSGRRDSTLSQTTLHHETIGGTSTTGACAGPCPIFLDDMVTPPGGSRNGLSWTELSSLRSDLCLVLDDGGGVIIDGKGALCMDLAYDEGGLTYALEIEDMTALTSHRSTRCAPSHPFFINRWHKNERPAKRPEPELTQAADFASSHDERRVGDSPPGLSTLSEPLYGSSQDSAEGLKANFFPLEHGGPCDDHLVGLLRGDARGPDEAPASSDGVQSIQHPVEPEQQRWNTQEPGPLVRPEQGFGHDPSCRELELSVAQIVLGELGRWRPYKQ